MAPQSRANRLLPRFSLLLLAVAVAPLVLVGCGGETKAHTDRVEHELKEYLHNRTGERFRSTSCPEHVGATKGTTYDCKATATTGRTYLVTMEQASKPHNGTANNRVVKVTRVNKREREVNKKYARIEIGQPEDEIREIFGKPQVTEGTTVKGVAGRVECRIYGGLNLAEPTIRICFQDGAVKYKARYGNG
jgi:Domain of unknown function (DUF4333)